VGRDYTVVAVQRSAGSDLELNPEGGRLATEYNFFLQGGDEWSQHNLHLGFEPTNLVHGHFAYDLRGHRAADDVG